MLIRVRMGLSLVMMAAGILGAGAQGLNVDAARGLVMAAHAKGTFDGVVVVSEGGKPLMVAAVGEADRGSKDGGSKAGGKHVAVRPETVFRLASLTKQVTALLVMQQVEHGKLRLEERAGEAMPGLPEAVGKVTIRQLLQHQSGLANPSDGPEDVVPAFYARVNLDDASNVAAAKGACGAAVKREPGGKFEYNNCDYIVLGAVLETLAGKSYASIVRERVIEPLGLTSWGVFPGNAAKGPKVALAYGQDGRADLFQNPATYGAAGALYGSALDVAKWDEALLKHTLLSAGSTEVMFKADPKLYGEALGSWAYDAKLGAGTVHLVERQGDIGSTVLLNLLLPEQGASVVVISNNETPDLFNTYSKKGIAWEVLQALFSGK